MWEYNCESKEHLSLKQAHKGSTHFNNKIENERTRLC